MGDGPKLVGLLTLTKCESVLDNITIIFIAFDDNFFLCNMGKLLPEKWSDNSRKNTQIFLKLFLGTIFKCSYNSLWW